MAIKEGSELTTAAYNKYPIVDNENLSDNDKLMVIGERAGYIEGYSDCIIDASIDGLKDVLLNLYNAIDDYTNKEDEASVAYHTYYTEYTEDASIRVHEINEELSDYKSILINAMDDASIALK